MKFITLLFFILVTGCASTKLVTPTKDFMAPEARAPQNMGFPCKEKVEESFKKDAQARQFVSELSKATENQVSGDITNWEPNQKILIAAVRVENSYVVYDPSAKKILSKLHYDSDKKTFGSFIEQLVKPHNKVLIQNANNNCSIGFEVSCSRISAMDDGVTRDICKTVLEVKSNGLE